MNISANISVCPQARLSGHGTILVPSLLVLLACAPSLDHEVQSSSPWPLVLIRFYLASAYFASGMCKLLCGVRFGTFWGRGSTLQMCAPNQTTKSRLIRQLFDSWLTARLNQVRIRLDVVAPSGLAAH